MVSATTQHSQSLRPFARIEQRGIFDKDLAGANLNFSELRNLTLERCDLGKASFKSSVLHFVQIEECKLAGAVFSKTRLADSSLRLVDFSVSIFPRAIFSDVTAMDCDYTAAVFAGVLFTGGHLIRCRFDRSELQGADFKGANISGCKFRAANFSDASFTQTYVHDSDLTSVVMEGTRLRNTRFEGCSFLDAQLKEAILAGCQFIKCNFTNTGFGGSQVLGCDFISCTFNDTSFATAKLDGVTYRGADFNETVFDHTTLATVSFANCDLSIADGLPSAVHRKPSTIGVDTLYRSKGRISEQFLMGAGLPEIFRLYIPDLVQSKYSTLFMSCFISYSSIDRRFANRLNDELEKCGIHAFLDAKDILPGDFIREAVHTGIATRDKVLLCVSQDSLTKSFWVDEEVTKALQREEQVRKTTGKKVSILIPLDLDGYIFDPKCDVPIASQLRSRSIADFRSWQDNEEEFKASFTRVLGALKSHRAGLDADGQKEKQSHDGQQL